MSCGFCGSNSHSTQNCSYRGYGLQQQNMLLVNPFAIVNPGMHRQPIPAAPITSDPQLLDLVAYRVWLIRDAYLISTSANTVWLPGAIIEGDVTSAGGVHAYKSLDGAIQHYLAYAAKPELALGTVRLWGAIVEHEFGYRASYARLLSILDVQISSPWSNERKRALAFFQAKYNYIEKESENDAIS